MKKTLLLLTVSVFAFLLSGCYMINGLLLSDQAKNLEGLWVSGGWDDEADYCYYDFRSDGRVFVTEWTDDLETTSIPVHFNYSVKDGMLKMSQYMGITKFEFSIQNDSDLAADYCHLRVEDFTSDFDFIRISYGEDFYLFRDMTYSREVSHE